MSNKKFTGSIGGKGYYIALVLCAVAIGISGFLYYRNTDKPNDSMDGNGESIMNPQNDQQVLATDSADQLSTTPSAGEPSVNTLPRKTVSPVEGQTVAVYAMDSLTYNETTRDWRVHNGIDIAAEAGTQVLAAAAGTVYTVYEDDTMGMTVVIRHADGYVTTYSSLAQEVSVEVGDAVELGQVIGTVGNTALLETAVGDHLHFSVTCNDASMDPAEFLAMN